MHEKSTASDARVHMHVEWQHQQENPRFLFHSYMAKVSTLLPWLLECRSQESRRVTTRDPSRLQSPCTAKCACACTWPACASGSTQVASPQAEPARRCRTRFVLGVYPHISMLAHSRMAGHDPRKRRWGRAKTDTDGPGQDGRSRACEEPSSSTTMTTV
jgi:hypothetical protein